MTRYFTLETATETLVSIRSWMEEIQDLRQAIIRNQPEAWPVIEKAAGNGGSRAASQLAQSFDRLDRLVHLILDTGAVVKDINTGLLDFPSIREGREVFLCWRLGEEKIAYWHETDAGFAGRQPLDPS
jgi:hypothetical protein